MSAGIAPRVEMAMQSGIEVGKRGIVVNDEMRTSHPHVFAAGDVAEWHGRLAGLWPMAQAMGRVAGLSAAGVKTSYSGGVPSAKLKIAGIEVWSQGDITGNRAKIVMAEDDRQNRVCKLFFSGGRLIGSIQIGTYKNTLRLKALMEDAVDVHGFEEQLLDEEFQIPK
jgi:nitrite reductase (NADH) large subunit